MPKFRVCWYEAVEYYVDVEATDGDDAQDKVFGIPGMKGSPTGQTDIDVSSIEELEEDYELDSEENND